MLLRRTFLPYIHFPVTVNQQADISLFDKYLSGQAHPYHFNGNVLISAKGRVIYQKSFGFADYATRRKLDENSVFDCGSIVKEFTATAIHCSLSCNRPCGNPGEG